MRELLHPRVYPQFAQIHTVKSLTKFANVTITEQHLAVLFTKTMATDFVCPGQPAGVGCEIPGARTGVNTLMRIDLRCGNVPD